jgi:exodeoxyribonuclease-5
MSSANIVKNILHHFPYQPTPGQQELVMHLASFLYESGRNSAFIIKGYAGTGKTTIVSALVKALPAIKQRSILLAPTGRAAKVLSNYSGTQAYTIHKKIYKQKANSSGTIQFTRQANPASNTIYIVDEASMLSDESSELSQQSLLNDLISYVQKGINCKLILVGDTAQLPPVGTTDSPALSAEYMQTSFDLDVKTFELNDVVRQQNNSGILDNATNLRELIRNDFEGVPEFNTKGFKDIFRMTGEKLEDGLQYTYKKYGIEDSVIVCRSNKQANQYNQHIRSRIFGYESEISTGDYIMVVRNNYFWLPENHSAGFIANGDIGEIVKIKGYKDMYGFKFAEIDLRLIDYPNEETVNSIIMLDTIMMESPALGYADNKKLFEAVMEDYADEGNRRKQIEKVKTDKYFNALQVKFAYAVTCHKAQGGQWKCVFVDQGYVTDDMMNTEYLRWLYTAITRASNELFLVNFNEKFFGGN